MPGRPQVVVRLAAGVVVPAGEALEDVLGRADEWAAVEAVQPGLRFTPVFEPAAVAATGTPNAAPTGPAAAGRLARYYQAAATNHDVAQALARALSGLHDYVDSAYVRGGRGRPPHRRRPRKSGGDPDLDDRVNGYLRSQPLGIGALAAWDDFKAYGQGVRIADIESGWFLDHQDLPKGIEIKGRNNGDQDHGSSSLGVMVARRDGRGMVGVAPEARAIAVSYVHTDEDDFAVAWAIQRAASLLNEGDIILLEAQCYKTLHDTSLNLPVEVDDDVYEAIAIWTAEKDLLFIEPAGNSSLDLTPWHLDRSESFALMVGGSRVDTRSGRHVGENSGSNYGKRVDCFAWGEKIYAPSNGKDKYREFGETSGAAAIIAGAAALVQSRARQLLEGRTDRKPYLTPGELRERLRSIGTPTDDGDRYPMGVMPDLSRVMKQLEADFAGVPVPATVPRPKKRRK